MRKLAVSILMVMSLACSCSHLSRIRRPNTRGHTAGFSSLTVKLPTSPETLVETVIAAVDNLALVLSAFQWDLRNVNNVVLSPISVSSLLGLILLGTRGDSFRELRTALQFSSNITGDDIHETFQTVLGSIFQQNTGVNVTINSRIFIQEGVPIRGTYKQVAQSLYNSEVINMDFVNNPSQVRDSINSWVDQTTYGKIQNLISQPFPSTTKYIAVNTIYFSGGWEYPFSRPLTNDGEFNTGTKIITIPMMTNLMTVPYLMDEGVGFDMISIPYKGGKYAMIIMTPTGEPGITSLQELEYTLYPDTISYLLGKMKNTKVSVTIPRMKLKYKAYLKADLQTLEARSIFDKKTADFGRLTPNPGVFIEDIVHEAVLEVTENGTVASAATAVIFDRAGGNRYFLLNKPSLLFIKDLSNELTLFFARIVEPEPIL